MKVIVGVILLFAVVHGLVDEVDIKDEQVLERDNLVAVISTLEKAYEIFFEMKINKHEYGFTSVFHLTTGQNNAQYGDRTPAIFLNEGFLHVGSAINGSANYWFNSPDKFPLNEWVNIHIRQSEEKGVYTFTVWVNHQIMIDEINSYPQAFDNVKVFVADPWYKAQDGLIKNIYIRNRYVDDVSEDDEQVLKRDNLVAVLSALNKSYEISFDLKINKHAWGFQNIIHLTTGKNVEKYGDRSPAIFLNDGFLHISSTINDSVNYWFNSPNKFPLNQWVNVHIGQFGNENICNFIVWVNNETIFEVKNFWPQKFKGVKVYAADPWYEAQDGSIKNFHIINRELEDKLTAKKDSKQKKAIGPKKLIAKKKSFGTKKSIGTKKRIGTK